MGTKNKRENSYVVSEFVFAYRKNGGSSHSIKRDRTICSKSDNSIKNGGNRNPCGVSSAKEEYALFNAVNLKVFYCDREFYHLYRSFRGGGRSLDGLSESELKLVEKLIGHRFIVKMRDLDKKKDQLMVQRKNALFHETHATGYIGRIRNLRLVLTERCNLACDYCFVRQNNQDKKQDMTLEALYMALDLMIEKNRGYETEIHFFGGEPLLKWDLIQRAVRYMNRAVKRKLLSQVHYAITTNATLITPQISKFFKENDFEVSISIDGGERINDLYRKDSQGRGTYKKVKWAFDILERDNNRIGLLLTPYKHNIQSLAEIIEYLVCNWGGFNWDNWGQANKLNLNPKNTDSVTQIGRPCQGLFSKRAPGWHVGISINSPQPAPGDWEFSGKEFAQQVYRATEYCRARGVVFESMGDRVFDALNTGRPQILSCNTYSNTTGILVTPEGLVSPCIVDWSMRDVLQPIESFSENQRFKEWKYQQLELDKKCKGCPAVNVCGGACSLENLEESRRVASAAQEELMKLKPKLKSKQSWDESEYLDESNTGNPNLTVSQRCHFFREFVRLAIWDDASS